jgi:hypothetical protein
MSVCPEWRMILTWDLTMALERGSRPARNASVTSSAVTSCLRTVMVDMQLQSLR